MKCHKSAFINRKTNSFTVNSLQLQQSFENHYSNVIGHHRLMNPINIIFGVFLPFFSKFILFFLVFSLYIFLVCLLIPTSVEGEQGLLYFYRQVVKDCSCYASRI